MRVSPVVELAFGDPAEDRVELVLGDQERVVLRLDRPVDLHDVERHPVGALDHQERSELGRLRQAEDTAEELRGLRA